jgi:hypothetical protein
MKLPHRYNSLALRLVLAAALWIGAALLIGGLVLSAIFKDYAERTFDGRLSVLLDSLIAVTELDEQGRPKLTRGIGEPRFDMPYSGWYWRSRSAARRCARARSGMSLPSACKQVPPRRCSPTSMAPTTGTSVWSSARSACRPRAALPLRRRRRSEIDDEVRRFNTTSAGRSHLGLGLLTAPLRYASACSRCAMRQAIVAVRTGRAQRLDGEFPVEIEPLSDELNILIDHNAAVLERARTQVSNLAHALKTPLSVLTNEAGGGAGPLAETVKRQTTAMRRHVDHYLSRARAAAATRVLGVRTDVAPVVEDLRRTLERIYVDRAIRVEAEAAPGLAFRGELQDLEESARNLIDNACKWARARFDQRARRRRPHPLTIDDDGRLACRPAPPSSTAAPASTIRPRQRPRLAIVRDIAELYHGAIALDDCLGGLRAMRRLRSAKPAG